MDAIRSHQPRLRARGFSLIELLVTLAVVAAISSLMFPAFGKVRQAALGLMCQNNMRSIFVALEQFQNENFNRMPDSSYAPRDASRGKPLRPQELMALTGDERDEHGNVRWDGLGLLFGRSPGGHGRYLGEPQAFYCPAHGSTHTYERYQPAFQSRSTAIAANSKETVYGNYHYWDAWNRAAIERERAGGKPGSVRPIAQKVILTDGMRTRQDFSHRYGCNALNLDGSVIWVGGNKLEMAVRGLPTSDVEVQPYDRQVRLFENIVAAIEPVR